MSKNNACKTPRWRLLQAQLNNLDAAQFKAKITAGNVQIVDVRTNQEFEVNHIENAIHINYFEEEFWEKIEQLDKSKISLIYCRSGRRSIRVCTLMKNGGFDADKIFNLKEGMIEWLEQEGNLV